MIGRLALAVLWVTGRVSAVCMLPVKVCMAVERKLLPMTPGYQEDPELERMGFRMGGGKS